MSSRLKFVLRMLLVFAAYFFAGRLGLATPFTSGNISPVWPASGIALAAVLLYGYSIWPAIFLGAFLTNLLSPIPPLAAFGIGVGDTLEALTAAALLNRFVDFRRDLSRLRDILNLITLGAMGGTIVGASVGVGVLAAVHVKAWSDIASAWTVYWLGDAMGILLVTPLILCFSDLKKLRADKRGLELLGLLILLTIASVAVFHQHIWLGVELDVLAFAVFPFVIWAAIRFGLIGCSIATLVISIIATVATAYRSGPFANYAPFIDASLLQVFFGVLSTSGLTLAAAVNEREQLNQARILQNARMHLAAIVENSDDAIISKDLNGIVSSWNAGAERLFGFTADEMIGSPILKIIPEDRHQEEYEFLSRLQRGEKIEHMETIRRHKNGELLHIAVTISPIRDASGKITGAAKIARNITERKKTEAALLTSEKLASVGRMAASIAHEINNPLEAVVNLIYLARITPDAPPYVQDLLSTADEELLRVSHLAKQTLGFYRETTAPSRASVAEVLRGVLFIYGNRVAARNLHVRVDAPPDLMIATVVGEFRQVVANLVQNALEAVPVGGHILIRASAAHCAGSPAIRVTIADDGPGISRDDLKHIFDPFFTTKKDIGTGLGLWVCRGIVRKHGGALSVRSTTGPDRSWTVFSVVWPNTHADLPAEAAFEPRRQQA